MKEYSAKSASPRFTRDPDRPLKSTNLKLKLMYFNTSNEFPNRGLSALADKLGIVFKTFRPKKNGYNFVLFCFVLICFFPHRKLYTVNRHWNACFNSFSLRLVLVECKLNCLFFLCRPRHFRDICQNLMDRKWLYKKWSTRKTYFRSFKLFCSARAVFSFYQGQILCAALLKIEKNTFCLKTNLCQNGSKLMLSRVRKI